MQTIEDQDRRRPEVFNVEIVPAIRVVDSSPLVGTTRLYGTWDVNVPFAISDVGVARLCRIMRQMLDGIVGGQVDGELTFALAERNQEIEQF